MGTSLPSSLGCWSPPYLFLGGYKPKGGRSQPARRGTSARCRRVPSSCGKPRSETGIQTSRSFEDLKACLWPPQLSRGWCRFLAEPSTPPALAHPRRREMGFALQGETRNPCPRDLSSPRQALALVRQEDTAGNAAAMPFSAFQHPS